LSRVSEKDLHDWLDGALSGDQNSYLRFLEAVTRIARGFLLSRGIRRQEVEDLVQEVLISVHKAKDSFDRKAPVLPWLFAIIQYRLADNFRGMSRNFAGMSDVEFEENSYTPNHEDRLFANQMLEALPNRDQKILRALKLEGQSVREISVDMGISESAVKVYAFRAIRLLRAKIGDSSDEN